MFVQTLPNYQIIYGGSLFQIQSYRLGVKSSPSAGLQLFLRENAIAYFPRDPPRENTNFLLIPSFQSPLSLPFRKIGGTLHNLNDRNNIWIQTAVKLFKVVLGIGRHLA